MMKTVRKMGWCGMLLGLCLGVPDVRADLEESAENPYLVISKRNAFGLRPPESEKPAPKEVVPEPEPEDTDIMLSGFSKIRDVKSAFFAVPDSENAGKFKFYNIREGERIQSIEVLEIDDDLATVRVRHNNRIMALNMDEHGFDSNQSRASSSSRRSTPRTARTTVTRPGRSNNNSNNNSDSNTASIGPRIISRGGQTNFNPPSPVNTTASSNSSSSSRPTIRQLNSNRDRSSSSSSSRSASLRSIPRRTTRTSRPKVEVNITPEEQVIISEAQREHWRQQGIPTPPPLPGSPQAPFASGNQQP